MVLVCGCDCDAATQHHPLTALQPPRQLWLTRHDPSGDFFSFLLHLHPLYHSFTSALHSLSYVPQRFNITCRFFFIFSIGFVFLFHSFRLHRSCFVFTMSDLFLLSSCLDSVLSTFSSILFSAVPVSLFLPVQNHVGVAFFFFLIISHLPFLVQTFQKCIFFP